jgi:predicted phosphodiesterase
LSSLRKYGAAAHIEDHKKELSKNRISEDSLTQKPKKELLERMVIDMAKRTIIHLSDLHIGRRQEESERTRRVFKKISESFPGIPVIITGDLTDSATKGQFKDTRKFFNKLAQTNPILSVPGNHDYAWKGIFFRAKGWKNWVKYLGSPLGWSRAEVLWMGVDSEPVGVDGLGVWKDGPCVYFGIDSGDPKDKESTARGYISKKLADSLKASLRKYKDKTRIAFLHHHPFTEEYFTALSGSKRLLEAVRGNCELLLFGHEHDYGIWWATRGVPLIVSSHKSTNFMTGDCLMITVIDIKNPGTKKVSFSHRIEVL